MAKKTRGKSQSTYGRMSDNWKTMLAQGAFALALGVIVLLVPNATSKVVSVLLGVFLLIYGILSMVSARSAQKSELPDTWLYARGGLAIAGGFIVLFWPNLRDITLVYILGVFAIVVGVVIGALGLFQKWSSRVKVAAGIGGLLSVIFGIILIAEASHVGSAVVQITGIYALALGLLLVGLAFGSRSAARQS